jgi:hypothetical protein
MKTLLLNPTIFIVVFLIGLNICTANTYTSIQYSTTNWRTNKPYIFSPNASMALQRIKNIGSEYGNENILQAIAIQETMAGDGGMIGGLNKPFIHRSYGLMQIQINSAKHIFKTYPKIFDEFYPGKSLKDVSDKEISNLLLTNYDANIHIAAALFNLYYKMVNNDLDKAIAAYNVGIRKVLKNPNLKHMTYVKDVKKHLTHYVVPFNDFIDNVVVVHNE